MKRLVERWAQTLDLVPLNENVDNGARRVRAIGVTADVVNGNGRIYPRAVLESAIAELNEHMAESAGQGRLLLGEAEHPSDKGGRPALLETVVKWQAAQLQDNTVLLDGIILPTVKGKDILTLIEHGVPVGVSMRGYGQQKPVKIGGKTVQEVTKLKITGFDLVAEPSDPYARLLESRKGETEMEEQDKELLAKLEEVQRTKEELERKQAETLKMLEEAQKAQAELEEHKRKEAVEAAIAEATKDLPYGEALNKLFVEAVRATKPKTPEEVAAIVEMKRKEYDGIASAAKLRRMGHDVQILGPVFERETGQPEFTRAAFYFTERLVERGYGQLRNFREAKTPSALFAKRYLELYDNAYKTQLLAESQRLITEAEQTSDLNLPYSVMRAIIAEAVPELVALSVFDGGFADTSPTRIYFENYAAESGAQPVVSNENITAVLGGWVNLAHSRIQPGTVTITNSGGTVTYTEYSDYLIDYANGRLYIVGTITNGQALKVSYTYDAVRTGEMGEIQRGKGQLSFKTIELAADRLAQQISDEAMTFARSQLGWDATTRTMSMIIREIRRIIDSGIMRLAIAQAHVANNNGGTWNSATDTLDDLVKKIGVAKVAVQKDYYMPTAILMSVTNADRLSNWSAFAASLSRPDTAMAPGALGPGDTGLRVKGLPVFASTEMPDNKILVVNRELVQYRVLATKPMTMKGPYPSYNNGKLVAADQYYVEEYNATVSLIAEKGGFVTVA